MTQGKQLTMKEIGRRAREPRPIDTTTKKYQRWYRARVALGLATKNEKPSQLEMIRQRKAIVSQQAK